MTEDSGAEYQTAIGRWTLNVVRAAAPFCLVVWVMVPMAVAVGGWLLVRDLFIGALGAAVVIGSLTHAIEGVAGRGA